MLPTGFAVVGCTKCRRKSVADLSYRSKTCQCGHKMDLSKTKLLAVFRTAEEAGQYLRGMQESNNTGFIGANNMLNPLIKN